MTAAILRIRFTEPGFHCWPQAPARRAYLRNQHRHLFHVEVATSAWHDDREIEFHDLRDRAVAAFKALGIQDPELVDGASCEMMARSMATTLVAEFKRSFTVQVWEDGEFGAEVTVS